jgi:hypothetical protein
VFTYRLHTRDGDDLGEATYPDRVKVGEELFFGGGRRFRVLDVVIFDEEDESRSWVCFRSRLLRVSIRCRWACQRALAVCREEAYDQWVMARWWLLIAQVAVLGAVMLALPSAGSAGVGVYVITLTPSGPSPDIETFSAYGGAVPVWVNDDQVTHTVVFANGLCTLHVAPGAQGNCTNDWFWDYVGRYPYTVDGTTQASLVVSPALRTVTLTARSHTFRRGARLLLHGALAYFSTSGIDLPPGPYSDMPVIVLARHDRQHAFHRIAMAKTGELQSSSYPWQLYVHPKTTTTYIAETTDQPELGQVWTNATSKPFRVVVKRKKR